ncbi:MAG: cobalamin-dependent protein, partial [Acutalibacteraceae bacterium]
IPALDIVGERFEKKTMFLPQLLMSAEAAGFAFDAVKSCLKSDAPKKDKIILATVKGDIHDIGKNIVKVLLQNYGYDVLDLGKDVPCETVLQAAKESGARLVGLSALMTTTVESMAETIRLLKKELPEVSTVVGGAVLTQEYADMIGATYYAKDAMETVRFAERYFE